MHSQSGTFHPSDPPSSAAPPTGCAPIGARNLVWFLYNHNPFYVISAALVLYGLRVSFLDGDAFQTRALILIRYQAWRASFGHISWFHRCWR